ncbi:MAG: phenylalanine--tRNA ligase subunit beta [Pseudomonadota bacterium]
MPVVGIPVKLLTERLDAPLASTTLVQHLQHLGCDVEGFATLRRLKCERCGNIVEITATMEPPVLCRRCGVSYTEHPELLTDLGENDVIRMELLAVRPDMFDPGGLARTVRGYLGQRLGMPRYEVGAVAARVEVHPAMLGAGCPRPAIACAVLTGIRLDDDLIKELMNLQENLHWALGRDRKHASIGVYDLATTEGSSFRYRPVGPEELRFVPLGYDPRAPAAAITPRQVLEEHPKGIDFARLLAGFERYPLLEDAAGLVLSMPPIINSEQTRVTDATTAFFIDVTGTNRRLVGRCLNVLVSSLVELQPSIAVRRVEIAYPDGAVLTPDFTPQVTALSVSATAGWIGIPLDAAQLSALLARMGHDVEVLDDDSLRVTSPAYRNDLMHPVDLMEDAAIAFGYHAIVPTLVPTLTVGGERPVERLSNDVRAAMAGLGWHEVMSLVLTCEERAFEALMRPQVEDFVRLENPISRDQTMLRTSLAAGLLETLTANAHNAYPQRIFEVGELTFLDGAADTGAVEHRAVGGVVAGERVGATDVRAAAECVLRELGFRIRTEGADLPGYLPGRAAQVFATRDGREVRIGALGELHPAALEAFRLKHPAAIFELDLTVLTGLA